MSRSSRTLIRSTCHMSIADAPTSNLANGSSFGSDPSLLPGAVEEFLRYDSSVQMTGRVALEDIADLGGRPIPRGESVMCLLGSANRDATAYPNVQKLWLQAEFTY